MTHQLKAVQDQIKAEISQNLRDLTIWLEIGNFKSQASGWILKITKLCHNIPMIKLIKIVYFRFQMGGLTVSARQ